MNARQGLRRIRTHVAVAICLAAMAPAALGQLYSIRELGPGPGGADAFAYDISPQGAIVGSAEPRGAFWSLLGGSPVGTFTSPSGSLTLHKINGVGEVAGWSLDSSFQVKPNILVAGQVAQLGIGDYYQGEAHCISNFFDDGYYGAVGRLFKTDSIPDGTDPKAPIRRNRAVAWNNKGQRIALALLDNNPDSEFLKGNVATTIGTALLAAGSSAHKDRVHEQAVVWSITNNSIVAWLNDHGTVSGMGAGGRVNDNRDNRYMCGYYYKNNSALPVACYWPNLTTVTEIGSLYGGVSQALAVQDSHYTSSNGPVIVGESLDPDVDSYHAGFTRAFRYNTATGLKDLNNLLFERGGWTLRSASGIDPDGRIVGWGVLNGFGRGFLLVPLKVHSASVSNTPLHSGQKALVHIDLLEESPVDTVINVRSSNPMLLQAPASFTIKRGTKSLDIPIVAGRIPARTTVTLSLALDDLTTDVSVSLQL
jgi:hypothetical protein